MNYMGIDHHKQSSHITLMNGTGEVLTSGRVSNYRSELKKFLQGLQDVKAVVEAGRSSYTMVDVLEDMEIAVTIAHLKEVKAIAKAKIKTDKIVKGGQIFILGNIGKLSGRVKQFVKNGPSRFWIPGLTYILLVQVFCHSPQLFNYSQLKIFSTFWYAV